MRMGSATVQRYKHMMLWGIVVRCSHCPSRPPSHARCQSKQKCDDVLYRSFPETQTNILPPNCSAPPRSTGIFANDRYHNTGNYNIKVSQQASHLVKHTDFISSLRTSVRMIVVVMELWTTHSTHARFAHASPAAWAHVPR
jgi:hypothetical protein